MIVNIVDRRNNRYALICDGAFEPAWHDNRVAGATFVEPQAETFSIERHYEATIDNLIQYGSVMHKDTAVTLYLYDVGALDSDRDGTAGGSSIRHERPVLAVVPHPVAIHWQAEAFIAKDDIAREDGGRAAIIDPDWENERGSAKDGKTFVRIQSWDEDGKPPRHPAIENLAGKRIRVTIETI